MIFTPKPDINYNVIVSMYAFGSVLSIAFYVLEKALKSEAFRNFEIVKENMDHLEGLYLVFCPFIPCLLWSLVVRYQAKTLLLNKDKKNA